MSSKVMTLKTEHLVIREWNIQDAHSFYPLSSDPGINAGPLPSFAQENISAAEKKIIEWALTFGQTKMGILPIFLANGKTLIGICGIKPRLLQKEGPMQFEVICQLSQEYMEAFTVEALQAISNYGFTELGLKELIHLCPPESTDARQVMEKSGMRFLKTTQVHKRPVDIFHVTAQ